MNPGYLLPQGPADSDSAISFLSPAADPGAFCAKKPCMFILQCACTCTVVLRVTVLLYMWHDLVEYRYPVPRYGCTGTAGRSSGLAVQLPRAMQCMREPNRYRTAKSVAVEAIVPRDHRDPPRPARALYPHHHGLARCLLRAPAAPKLYFAHA